MSLRMPWQRRAAAATPPSREAPDLMGSALRFAYGDRMEPEAGVPEVHPNEFAFASYLDRALSAHEEGTFEKHVAFCPRCAAELALARRAGLGRAAGSGVLGSGWLEGRSAWKMAASVALVAGGAVAVMLAGRALQSRVEEELLARLRDRFGGKASIEDVGLAWRGPDGNVAPGVRLGTVRVAGDPKFGPDPLLAASQASLHVDLAALRDGEVRGQLVLDHPVVNLVRDASGRVNLDTLLPGAGAPRDLLSEARRRHVSGVQVQGGTVRWVDRGGGPSSEIRFSSVDAELEGLDRQGPARLDLRAGVDSSAHNLALSGELSEGATGLRYALSRFELRSVALGAIPATAGEVRGRLSFDGSLESAGSSWEAVSAAMSARGQATIEDGALAGRNVLRDVVGPAGEGVELPARAATLLAAGDTRFQRLGTTVALSAGRFDLAAVAVAGEGWNVAGHGSLLASGAVGFEGRLRLAPEVTREVVAAIAAVSPLVDEAGQLSIPFRMNGNWPAVNVSVDAERLASEVLRRTQRSRIVFLATLGPLG